APLLILGLGADCRIGPKPPRTSIRCRPPSRISRMVSTSRTPARQVVPIIPELLRSPTYAPHLKSNSLYPPFATASHHARYAGALPLYRAMILTCFPSTLLFTPVNQEFT